MVTMINVWSVEPANQQRLIEILTRATEATVVSAQGFRGATLHKSLDGMKVTMVAEWQSAVDVVALRDNPKAREFLAEALAIATMEPGLYETAGRYPATA